MLRRAHDALLHTLVTALRAPGVYLHKSISFILKGQNSRIQRLYLPLKLLQILLSAFTAAIGALPVPSKSSNLYFRPVIR